MELGHVGAASFVGMSVQLIVAFSVPVALLIWVYRKKKAKLSTFFIGGATFIVFALILEQLLHMVVLKTAGAALKDNIWLYGLYGGFAAALFEETGRFVTMRFFMKKRLDLPNALMYGVGHGGTEAILIVGLSAVSNLVTSVMVNTGAIEMSLSALDEETASAALEQISGLWTTPAYQFYLGGIERIFAITLHIALSVLVFLAVKNRKKYCWAIAFALHFLADFAAVVCANYLPLWSVELLVGIMAAISVWTALCLYQREEPELSEVGKLSELSE